jgi:hypothetical protein
LDFCTSWMIGGAIFTTVNAGDAGDIASTGSVFF